MKEAGTALVDERSVIRRPELQKIIKGVIQAEIKEH